MRFSNVCVVDDVVDVDVFFLFVRFNRNCCVVAEKRASSFFALWLFELGSHLHKPHQVASIMAPGYWGTPTSTLDWCEKNYEVRKLMYLWQLSVLFWARKKSADDVTIALAPASQQQQHTQHTPTLFKDKMQLDFLHTWYYFFHSNLSLKCHNVVASVAKLCEAI